MIFLSLSMPSAVNFQVSSTFGWVRRGGGGVEEAVETFSDINWCRTLDAYQLYFRLV